MNTEDAGRLLRTVSHLRASQVWHRARLSLRRTWWSRRTATIDARYRRGAQGKGARLDWRHAGLLAVAELGAARRKASDALEAAREVLSGRFTLLGETRELGLPVPWDRPDLMQVLLWKTHLHEFPWAVDLALAWRATRDERFREAFLGLARDWVAAQPIARPGFQRVAWNERVVATRILHWSVSGALLELRRGEADADWLAEEIARQALFLRDNLALDLQANHLFRDCVALACADELLALGSGGLALLERQVAEQILPDGGHFERSPMYHAICLADLIDTHGMLGPRAPAWLGDALRRAAGFLESVLLGDGDLSLFGDAWRGEVDPGVLLAQARSVAGPAATPEQPERWSGLVRLGRGDLRAVIRCGPHGPDHQLGHAHADLLSFEASFGATRIVADTGTATYAAGPVRQHLRSTAAHNTVQLDGKELLEAWSSFRSGRRGRARCHARGEDAAWCWLSASHDGWRWLPGAPVHHRLLLVGDDSLLALDVVRGASCHRIESRLHLHPDAPAALHVQAFGGPAAPRVSPLHERFGETREREVRVVETEAELPWLGGFWLRVRAPRAGPAAIEAESAGERVQITISDGDLRLDLRWDPGAEGPGAVVVG
jgi:uncharacterized heparinase superfamily protein